MNELHSGILHSLIKTGGIGTLVGAGIGTALAGVALHDAVRTAQLSHKGMDEFMHKNPVNTKQHIKKLDKKIKIVSDTKDLDKFIKKELKDESAIVKSITQQMMENALKNEDNAFAYAGETGDYIITGKKTNPVILEHEVGHIFDFRDKRKKGTINDDYHKDSGFLRSLGRDFLKSIHDEDVIKKEKAAWKYVKPSNEKKEVEEAAINSYNRAFYSGRGKILGAVGGGILGALIGKKTGLGAGLGIGIGMPLGMMPTMLSGSLTEGVK